MQTQLNKTFLLIALLINCRLFSQQAVYTKSIGGFNSELLLPDDNNSLIIIGQRTQICKVNSSGGVVWFKNYLFDSLNSYAAPAHFFDAIRDLDSNIAIVGQTLNETKNGDAFCMKIKPNGDTLWCRKLKTINSILYFPYQISLTNDSGYVITGSALSTTLNAQKMFVAKVSKQGQLSWLQTYLTSNFCSDGYAVKQTPDSGFVVVGAKQMPGLNKWAGLLMKTDKNGLPQWSRIYNDPASSQSSLFDIIINPTNFTLLFGGGKIGLLNFDFNGNENWTKYYNKWTYRENSYDKNFRLKKTKNNGYLIIDKSVDSPSNFVLLTDSSGNPIWNATPFLTRVDALQNKDKTFSIIGNRNYYLVKSSVFFNAPDIQIYKADSLGENSSLCYGKSNSTLLNYAVDSASFAFTTTLSGLFSAINPTIMIQSIESYSGCLVHQGGINENSLGKTKIYPNPANTFFTVNLIPAARKSLSVKLMDVTGKIILSQQLPLQQENYEINCSKIKDGIYSLLIFEDNILAKTNKLIIAH